MTTIDTITDKQIDSLMTEAGQAGDHLQAAICLVALGRPYDDVPLTPRERDRMVTIVATESSRAECARVIAAAEAMGEAQS